MNRFDHPAPPGLANPNDARAEDSLDDLLIEEVSAEEWDASHLPSFTA